MLGINHIHIKSVWKAVNNGNLSFHYIPIQSAIRGRFTFMQSWPRDQKFQGLEVSSNPFCDLNGSVGHRCEASSELMIKPISLSPEAGQAQSKKGDVRAKRSEGGLMRDFTSCEKTQDIEIKTKEDMG